MQECILPLKVYLFTEKNNTNKIKALLTRFILKYDEKYAETLTHIYSSILLNPTADSLNGYFLKQLALRQDSKWLIPFT